MISPNLSEDHHMPATKKKIITRERLKAGNYFSKPKSEIDFIPSGSLLLDLALGGGWAENRISNIVGDKSTGKTLLCIEGCANFARINPKGRIRYRETEAAFDKGYAHALGLPEGKVDFGTRQLETVEDLFDDLSKIVTGAKQKELVIVDSLDALSDRGEMDRDISQGSYGAEKAKKMSQLFRRLVREMERKQVTLIIVSQVRDKIGVTFGAKHTRTGGRALDFYATQVAMLAHIKRITKTVKGLTRATGVKVLAKMDKNKISLPFREAEFSINFGYGINDAQACIDWLKKTHQFKPKTFGMTDAESKNFLPVLLDMTRAEEREEIKRLHDAVSASWYDIETSLMPVRSKYG